MSERCKAVKAPAQKHEALFDKFEEIWTYDVTRFDSPSLGRHLAWIGMNTGMLTAANMHADCTVLQGRFE